jgi:predicted transporter
VSFFASFVFISVFGVVCISEVACSVLELLFGDILFLSGLQTAFVLGAVFVCEGKLPDVVSRG